jgi:arsenate reductase
MARFGDRGDPMDVIIYHNPQCGTSHNTIGLIRNAGIEPHIIEYLKTPPTRLLLRQLIQRMGVPVRAVLRQKGSPYNELGLDNASLTDDQLLDAMAEHPILIERPIVVTPAGVKLCRPSEVVLDILPVPQLGEFRKEDGEIVIDAAGRRAATA